jgi:acyl-coenzyme A synthetase/AMP-(fatty) acid ligase
MPTLPLIAHRDLGAAIAWRDSARISVRQFLNEVGRVADQLPPGRHVLNLCGDRYRFAVALMACIVSGRVSLLPSSHTPEMVGQMRRIAADLFCISDQDRSDVDLPVFRYDESRASDSRSSPPPQAGEGPGEREPAIPQIDCNQIVAHVFTSGSTGAPIPHLKRWGSLLRNVRAEAMRLGITARHAVVGTVPAQHMYGLESTVLMPLQSGAALHAGHPFYPADICAALADLPRPRVLVTTPYHLRALLADQHTLPAADLLLSATAPLSANLAAEAEAAFAAPLYEIYGCTETGQLASRRTTAGAAWQTLADIRLRLEGDAVWAEGGHIEAPTRLSDVIELVDANPSCFLLHGRHADLVNIAGKRTSLGYLNHQLNAIPGVRDGIFILPAEQGDDGHAGVQRLTALVVAPELSPSALMQALRQRIDPIFLPRPLLFVDALPRNATGKLPNQAARAFLASLLAQTTHRIPA